MSTKILLLFVMTCFITMLHAQSKKSTTAYAITTAEKGQSNWKEIKLVDIKTGEALQSIYSANQQMDILNARSGKPVMKRDAASELKQKKDPQIYVITDDGKMEQVKRDDVDKLKTAVKKVIVIKDGFNEKGYDNPFATSSAALAYDKKHERLYYTPMGINQLRYIDLKSKTPKVYYFEDEDFGTVKNAGDVPNQITRMVIASDGNGYALSNNAEHLIQFTTGKRPTIKDLGALTDDASSANFSIKRGVGGDIIADNAGNLYLVTAYKNILKINIETKVATYKGSIKGLPEGYQTNGAVVADENKIIVCSGTSTEGYYQFDLDGLNAEKVSSASNVFNASDLANGNLLNAKKKDKDEEQLAAIKEETPNEESRTTKPTETAETGTGNGILVYPNPVTDGIVKLSFTNQAPGRYNITLLDMEGRTINTQNIIINNKTQVQELKLPAGIGKGTYLIKITGEDSRTNNVTKLTVQ